MLDHAKNLITVQDRSEILCANNRLPNQLQQYLEWLCKHDKYQIEWLSSENEWSQKNIHFLYKYCLRTLNFVDLLSSSQLILFCDDQLMTTPITLETTDTSKEIMDWAKGGDLPYKSVVEFQILFYSLRLI